VSQFLINSHITEHEFIRNSLLISYIFIVVSVTIPSLTKKYNSDVVETATFKTETKTWLKFRDPETRDLKFETETETSNFVHFAEIFQNNVVITSEHRRPQWGRNGNFFHWDWTKHQDSLENMKLVAQFRSSD